MATVLLALPMFAPAPASAGPLTLLGLPSTKVILTGPGIGSLASTVSSLGGSVVENLTAINGVLASVPNIELPVLNAIPGLLVSPDLPVSVSDAGFAQSAPSGRSPAAVFPQSTGATQLEAQGVNGSGVAVAVLDTGIDNLPDFSGRLIDGVDLSGEGNPYKDSYGHGTFVAGLIAGNGASSAGQYTGEAPGANLVAVKVAGASGQTDMASVILGIGWTMAHRANDHIGVLNLSLGMQPYTSTVLNPLDKAVEAAWGAGITVVVAAGNAGPFNGTILSPGDDPMVVTVGGLDDNGTAATSDDTMSSFSSVGPTNPDGWFKPDVVASGRSVVSLRAPGSTVDQNYPSARIGSANFVGSGTSFSTAIASGAAALVLQADGASVAGNPNAVKARLLGGATPGPVGNPVVDGHGSLNAFWAATAAGNVSLNQAAPLLPTLLGTTVSLATTWSASSWNPNNWTGSIWNGTAWNGTAWDHTAWDGTAWDHTAWDGTAWDGTAWDGTAWNGTAWDHTAWDGTAWDGTAWDGTAWNGTAWDSSAWG
ncbi:MAG TPA: S8 family serine peptidase [Acidimicrobiales bacterium]|nr:S8 family serine peptidase [Acidimicrobiales bacterium]